MKEILISMDTRIIRSLIRGDLARQYRTSLNIKKILDELWRQATVGKKRRQPIIYVQYIVNKNGTGLNKPQLLELIVHLREYCDKADARYPSPPFIVEVDKRGTAKGWHVTMNRLGRRKYLNRTIGFGSMDCRKIEIEKFCVALEKYLENEEHPERFPLRYVGYTACAVGRFKSHRLHIDSSYLLNLIQAMSEVLFRDEFGLDQYVVALLTSAPQASIGEIGITRLTRGNHIHQPIGVNRS